jgi:Flp pilus assembly protein TadD
MEKILFLIILFVFSIFTFQRNSIWKNEYTLWNDVVHKSPNIVRPHVILGTAFLRRGALDWAEKEFISALNISQHDPRIYIGLGFIYFQRGLPEEAIKQFQIVTQIKPEFPAGHTNLGAVYMEKGLLEDTRIIISKIDPSSDAIPISALYKKRMLQA